MKKILFVCTGNICRSPTAEAVMRQMLNKAGFEDIKVDSCGVHGYHEGEHPDSRSMKFAKERGYDMSGQRARKLQQSDFKEYDHIFALDRGHLQHLLNMADHKYHDRIFLLLEFAKIGDSREVPDPYYGEDEDFKLVLDLIESACAAILERLY